MTVLASTQFQDIICWYLLPEFLIKYPVLDMFIFNLFHIDFGVLPDSSVDKESACKAGDPGSIPGLGRSTGEWIGYSLQYYWASLVALLVKNPPTMQETWVLSLCWEDPLEKYSGLESSTDCIVHRVTKSQTLPSNLHFTSVGFSEKINCRLSFLSW